MSDRDYESRLTKKVLVVVDDPDFNSHVCMLLREHNPDYRVLSCGKGNTAVDLCLEHRPQVVVLDQMLPGKSGLFVYEKIMKMDEVPYLVMVTVNPGIRHKTYVKSMGINEYFSKPVSDDDLVAAVNRGIRAKSGNA